MKRLIAFALSLALLILGASMVGPVIGHSGDGDCATTTNRMVVVAFALTNYGGSHDDWCRADPGNHAWQFDGDWSGGADTGDDIGDQSNMNNAAESVSMFNHGGHRACVYFYTSLNGAGVYQAFLIAAGGHSDVSNLAVYPFMFDAISSSNIEWGVPSNDPCDNF